ncbi:MAG: histidinol-phosphatase family [Clostridia bacterium]|nr:histidinol-phosphatase family [Clostridia bacterium]
MPSDYHIHGLAHDGPPHTINRLLPYVKEAKISNLSEIGFAEHDRYLSAIDFNVFYELEKLAGIPVRAGLEVDFYPGQRSYQEDILNKPWDYIIGSVHAIGKWEFDRPGEEKGFDDWDIDDLYKTYFEIVGQAAATGFFQVIGHLDLIKIYGHRPKKNVLELVEPTLQIIAKSGVAMELNTAGLFKPVAEIYPEYQILERAFDLNIPVIISSDAHIPLEVGRERKYAEEILKGIGYTRLAKFYKQKMSTEPL